MKILAKTIGTVAVLSFTLVAQAENVNADLVAKSVKQSVSEQPGKVIEIVSAQLAQHEAAACEIVKAAIIASKADKDLVAKIVQAATEVAPEKVGVVGQCAVAVAPDAIAEVQIIITKFAAASGGGAGVGAAPPFAPINNPTNPLNFPGQGPVGPTTGGPGGFPLFPPGLQPPVVSNSESTTPSSIVLSQQ